MRASATSKNLLCSAAILLTWSRCRDLVDEEEFESLVQRNMALNAGINLYSFAEFLATIAVRQLERLHESNVAGTRRLLETFSLHRCMLALKAVAGAMSSSGQNLSTANEPFNEADSRHMRPVELSWGADEEDLAALQLALQSLRESSPPEAIRALEYITAVSEASLLRQSAVLQTGNRKP